MHVKIMPSTEVIKVGSDVEFECKVYYLGLYSIKWTHNNNNLPQNADYINNFLVVRDVQEVNSGIYSCEVIADEVRGIGRASSRLEVVRKF